MNTLALKADRWWATYLKAAAFLAPPLVLWMATVVFIYPKLQQIASDAGGQPLPSFLRTMVHLTSNGWWILAGLGAIVAAFEWTSETWGQYRRVIAGTAVFLFNSVVLSLFFVMLVAFGIFAPALVNVPI